jgi:tetratricopeptide (TPR) repeat protein
MTRRLALLLALVVLAGVAFWRLQQPPPGTELSSWTPPVSPISIPRPWRWATESEWVVHDVTRHLVSWSHAGADGFPTVKVAHREPARGPLTVTLTSAGRSRSVSLEKREHAWDPAIYVPLARSLATAPPAPSGREPKGWSELVLSGDPKALVRADELLFAELVQAPHDAALHEKAALLWAAMGLDATSHALVFVNGASAHLAMAEAWRPTGHLPGREGAIAAAIVDVLLNRQVEAMVRVDSLEASPPDAVTRAWIAALRLRITHDPRLISESRARSRREAVEGVIAVSRSRTCGDGLERARAWGIEPEAAWVGPALQGGTCHEPASGFLRARLLPLYMTDTFVSLKLKPQPLESLVPELTARSRRNSHQPSPPVRIVPDHVRADSAAWNLLTALRAGIADMQRLGNPEGVKLLDVSTSSMRRDMVLAPLLEVSLADGASRQQLGRPLCQDLARLISDRPDLFEDWHVLGRCTTSAIPLLKMVPPGAIAEPTLVPGTGRLVYGPWQAGLPLKEPHLAETARRTPWDRYLAYFIPSVQTRGVFSHASARASYARLLDYDVHAMRWVSTYIYDDDDELERMAVRICELDVEDCATQAERLFYVNRDVSAERLWKRALADAEDSIALSNRLRRYVSILLDRGDVDEALRVARWAAGVHSGSGLATLSYAYERLGRYEEAAAELARVTRRYGDRSVENAFYVRYAYRHGKDRFVEEARMAQAELFPGGLQQISIADVERTPRTGVGLAAWEISAGEYRAGFRAQDIVYALDGLVVENRTQLDVLWSLSDGPGVTAIVRRRVGNDWKYLELKGECRRTGHGPVPRTDRVVPGVQKTGGTS